MRLKNVAVLLFGLLCSAPVFAEVTTFSPTKNVETTLVVDGSTVKITVNRDAHSQSRTIEFEALNKLHVNIDDYNFDGMKDFSIRQTDDGMGTYTVDRVFVYQPQTGSFQELRPDCGDGFANLRIESKRRALISTYWALNEPKQCVTRFPKRRT